jgi:asparagine synthase (glutamine-hydrolysing)
LKPEVFLEELPNAFRAMDIPSGDGINSYVVSKEIAKNQIKVAVSGVGGDELFAGYPGFKQWYSLYHKRWLWNIPLPVRKFGASLLPGSNKKFSRIKELLQTKELKIGSFYPLVRQIFSDSQINGLLKTDRHQAEKILDLHGFPVLSQFSIAELTGYTQNTLLKDTDQFSMAVSLEVREPFFDSDLIGYVLQIPDKMKYPHYPKQLLVESLGDLLPPEIVHRKKKGFTFPWEHWMRNELQEFSSRHIHSLAERDFMQKDATIGLWTDFLAGKNTRWSEIWLLVVLESWLQQNFD